MEFPDVPMIAIVSPYLVSHTVENIQPQHVVIEGSPAVRETKVSKFSKNYLFNLNFLSLFLLIYIPLKNQESCQGRSRSLKDWFPEKLG